MEVEPRPVNSHEQVRRQSPDLLTVTRTKAILYQTEVEEVREPKLAVPVSSRRADIQASCMYRAGPLRESIEMARDGVRRHTTIDINVPRLGQKLRG